MPTRCPKGRSARLTDISTRDADRSSIDFLKKIEILLADFFNAKSHRFKKKYNLFSIQTIFNNLFPLSNTSPILSKISENRSKFFESLSKISENLSKISENLSKILKTSP